MNALGALAISSDLISFKKQGIIVPQIEYEEFDSLADTNEVLEENIIGTISTTILLQKKELK